MQPNEKQYGEGAPIHANEDFETSDPARIDRLIFDKINLLQNSIEELKSLNRDGGPLGSNAYGRHNKLDASAPAKSLYLIGNSDQQHSHSIQNSLANHSERFAPLAYQTQSVNSVGLVDEAERKLQELEALLSMLRGEERYSTAPKIPIYPDTRSLQERSFINVTKKDNTELFDNLTAGESSVTNFEKRTAQNKQKLNSYALELQKQIEDDKRRKEEQRRLELEEDRKKEKEMSLYDQFGQKLVNETSDALTKTEEPVHQDRVKSEVVPVPGKVSTFARGGNGVFGQPLTQSQKEANDRYRRELEEQIAERKKREIEEKQRREEEDRLELERIEAERKKIAEELAAEKVKSCQQCRVFEAEPQAPSPELENAPEKICKSPSRHSVCLQTQPIQERRAPPTKVNKESNVTQKDFSDESLLVSGDSLAIISQIKRLRAELVAEKRRITALEILPEPDVQVFDPRSVFAPIKAPLYERSGRPMKTSRPKFHAKGIVKPPTVFLMDGSELQPLRPVRPVFKGCPDSKSSPRRPLKSHHLAPVIRRRSTESVQIDNSSSFVQLPYRHPERFIEFG
ncbi:hypothetical protein AAHC03_05695 [Spirometra sp. Aus1]